MASLGLVCSGIDSGSRDPWKLNPQLTIINNLQVPSCYSLILAIQKKKSGLERHVLVLMFLHCMILLHMFGNKKP